MGDIKEPREFHVLIVLSTGCTGMGAAWHGSKDFKGELHQNHQINVHEVNLCGAPSLVLHEHLNRQLLDCLKHDAKSISQCPMSPPCFDKVWLAKN